MHRSVGGGNITLHIFVCLCAFASCSLVLLINSSVPLSCLPDLCHTALLPALNSCLDLTSGCFPVLNLCLTCNLALAELWVLTLSACVCLWGEQGNSRSHNANQHVPSNHISWQGQAEINQTAKLITLVQKHFNETIKWIWQQTNVAYTDSRTVSFVLLPLVSFDFLTSHCLCWGKIRRVKYESK